jgi:predicted regulator of Ras-like GTPase activity (Roadblock/LC7/MglB family)
LFAATLRYDYTWNRLISRRNPIIEPKFEAPYRSESLAKTRTEQLVARLRDLQASSGDVEAAAIVSVDGLSIASSLPVGTEEDRVSAMSAAMLSLGERISSELGRGLLQQVFVKGENGYVILTAVGEEAVLTVLARKEAKLGLIFLDVARTVQDLEQLL